MKPRLKEPSDPICQLCSKPICASESVHFQHGNLLHIRCPSQSQNTQLRAMELRETAGELVERAQGIVAATTRAFQRRAPLAGLTVLLVEDHAHSRDALRLLLQAAGARALVARDGPEALQVLATIVPSVVLADIRMPGMDGRELARRIRAAPAFASVGLIAVSGVTTPEMMADARAAGFDSYMVKPIDGDALIRTLRERFRTRPPSAIR